MLTKQWKSPTYGNKMLICLCYSMGIEQNQTQTINKCNPGNITQRTPPPSRWKHNFPPVYLCVAYNLPFLTLRGRVPPSVVQSWWNDCGSNITFLSSRKRHMAASAESELPAKESSVHLKVTQQQQLRLNSMFSGDTAVVKIIWLFSVNLHRKKHYTVLCKQSSLNSLASNVSTRKHCI